ncbi:hypothetical protein HDV57DRAFT_506588 [Trichoderma longibrachiatum]
MPSSAQDAASAQAKHERKLAKKARKAARKAEEPQLKGAAEVYQESAAQGKKEKNKKDAEVQEQVLELEKKRHHHLAESKKLEIQVELLLKQAHNAAKVLAWVAKALDGAPPDYASPRIKSDDDDVSDADSSDGKNTGTVMKDAVDAPQATSKTDGEKKKKKKDKKKPKIKREETSSDEGQVGGGKRKHQDDDAEQPANKKGKKAKESKGGEKEAHATAEEVKIEGLEGGKARQDKFLRLLGGKKAGVSVAKPGSIASKNQGKSVRAEAAIQQQFEAGMALKESGQKRRGLGA